MVSEGRQFWEGEKRLGRGNEDIYNGQTYEKTETQAILSKDSV